MFKSLRRALTGTPALFDPAWRQLLEHDFVQWNLLTNEELERMELLVAKFFHQTRWEAANGFELTDGIKVLIAAQACVLLLGLEIDGYPQLTSVIVHPSTVRLHGEYSTGGGIRASGTQSLLGQAHYQGPVVLSWNAAQQGARFPGSGTNVVYHEFAHQLDMLDGVTDGTPPLGDEAARERWVEVCTAAYDTVRAEGSPVLRPYAGTNPAEFFAVATEVFFSRPLEIREFEPALYGELRSFYRQDPAARLDRLSEKLRDPDAERPDSARFLGDLRVSDGDVVRRRADAPISENDQLSG
jgi:Mlc titration factor MtfA (ptsG expression regulator)